MQITPLQLGTSTTCNVWTKMYVRMGKSRTLAVTSLAFLLASCACAFALDPSLDVSQYAHTVWKVRDGFAKGTINSLAQTPDGYLWVGTESGLLRFDGIHPVPWQPPLGQQLPGTIITSLLATHDGTLWIGTFIGLASWKDGKLNTVAELASKSVTSIIQDQDGTVWIGVYAESGGEVCDIRHGAVHCQRDSDMFGTGVMALYEDHKGSLWLGTFKGLWRWKPGNPQRFSIPEDSLVTSFAEDEQGHLLCGTYAGIRRLVDSRIEPYPSSGSAYGWQVRRMLRDHDGGLWVGTSERGLVHIDKQGRTDHFSSTDGLSGDSVLHLLEDREGSIWVGTYDGIDRFREYAVPTISAKQGLSSANVGSALSTRDGSLWVSTFGGLNHWRDGKVDLVGTKLDGDIPEGPLFEDSEGRIFVSTRKRLGYLQNRRYVPIAGIPMNATPRAITEVPLGHLWVSTESAGLLHLYQQHLIQQISWSSLGHNDFAPVIAADPSQRGLWLGFHHGGVAYFNDGAIRKFDSAEDGLGKGTITDLRFGPRGTLWVATDTGLSRIKDGHVTTLTSKNGLPCEKVVATMQDNDRSMWIYLACGLVRITQSELDAWVADPSRVLKSTVFDASDGVRSHAEGGGFQPLMTKSADGRIWFLPWDGVSVIDPHHLPFNKIPPPVHIENIAADDKPLEVSNGMHLPTGVRHLDIDYTALSLVVPEKVRFRVKLEGEDNDWRELVNVRHVEYTNLPPKHYRFRVLACNNSGVWNEEGATLDFVIPPAWYQTNWFRAACIALFLAMIWGLHKLRVRQLAHEFNMGLEQRVAERTRIARELHDTLLQSFQALLPLFQVGIKKLPESAVDSRKTLQLALDRASEAIGEGRDAIKGLRMSTIEKNDLAMAIRTIGEEFAAGENGQNSISFQLLVEGTPRELHPILRDEIYRLAMEALRNSFRHADAKNVEVEIRYDEKYFRLRVRDDGKGIPSDVLNRDGREGHYGLPGMRERAKLVGGKLTIWTELDSGTEIELVIPGAKAYVKSARPFWYFGKRSSAETDEKETIEHE